MTKKSMLSKVRFPYQKGYAFVAVNIFWIYSAKSGKFSELVDFGLKNNSLPR